jgi:predicted nucleic-acid-binding protein
VIALDTNVLVRFLVEDDEAQTERVRAFLARTIEAGDRCFISDVVVCEIVWVLESRYKFDRLEISRALERLLHARHLAFASIDLLFRALVAYASRRGDFADYLIREHALAHACAGVATFDGDLLEEDGFLAVQ